MTNLLDNKKKRGRPKKEIILVEPKQPEFFISLSCGGNIFEGKGNTILEALRSIPRPLKINSKGLFTISQGNKIKKMLFYPLRLKRVFFPASQPTIAKYFSIGLK